MFTNKLLTLSVNRLVVGSLWVYRSFFQSKQLNAVCVDEVDTNSESDQNIKIVKAISRFEGNCRVK